MKVGTRPSSVRKQFYRALLNLREPYFLSLSSVALPLGVDPTLLTRYLAEARRAGWIATKREWGGMRITILNRDGLQGAADGTSEARG